MTAAAVTVVSFGAPAWMRVTEQLPAAGAPLCVDTVAASPDTPITAADNTIT